VLKAVGRRNGRQAAEFVLRTAGEARRIALIPDVTRLVVGGQDQDISHVEFRIVDHEGVRVPDADALVTFDVDGPARLLAVGNADLNSTENCLDGVHRPFQGRGLAILKATGAGTVALKALSPGLEPGTVTIAAGRR
jgi:beta-galactosidase